MQLYLYLNCGGITALFSYIPSYMGSGCSSCLTGTNHDEAEKLKLIRQRAETWGWSNQLFGSLLKRRKSTKINWLSLTQNRNLVKHTYDIRKNLDQHPEIRPRSTNSREMWKRPEATSWSVVLTCTADKENGSVLFSNDGWIHLYGCLEINYLLIFRRTLQNWLDAASRCR